MKSRFENIESLIEHAASELDAIVTKDRKDFSWEIKNLEERRIDWMENGINKAIIIQPTFTYQGLDNEQWNFNLVAWHTDKKTKLKSSYTNSLVCNQNFKSIEKDVKSLLNEGINVLSNIEIKDLNLNIRITLILDLDGVLVTTPNWKSDEMDTDGYSKFNENCVFYLNKLLEDRRIFVWIISTRRLNKSIGEMRTIFRNRSIETYIDGYVPHYNNCKTRKDEVLKFISEKDLSNFIIIDDDTSLNGLSQKMKDKLVLTQALKGFNEEKLIEAQTKIRKLQIN